MKHFVMIVNGFRLLTIITKHSILDVAAALDGPLLLKIEMQWRVQWNEKQLINNAMKNN